MKGKKKQHFVIMTSNGQNLCKENLPQCDNNSMERFIETKEVM